MYVQQLGISSTPQCLQDLLTPREVVDDPHTARCRLFELLLLDFIAAEVGRGEGKLDKEDKTKRKAELLMFVVYKAGASHHFKFVGDVSLLKDSLFSTTSASVVSSGPATGTMCEESKTTLEMFA